MQRNLAIECGDMPVARKSCRAFLTYARSDTRFVFWTKNALEALGVNVWIDVEQIRGGSIENAIISGLKECDYQIISARKPQRIQSG